MRFTTTHGRTDRGERTLVLQDTARGAAVIIRPDCGGTVGRIALSAGTETAVDILDPNPERIPTGESSCRDPYFPGRILWPFSDRIPRGIYWFEGQDYHLPINDPESGDAIHGLISDRSLEILSATSDDAAASATLRATIDPGDVDGYTFSVTLEITYRLDAAGFSLYATGSNNGGRPAPMGLGWHPYFSLPGATTVDVLDLWTSADRYVPVDDRLLPTGEIKPVADTPYDFTGPDGWEIAGLELDIALTGGVDPITTVLRSQELSLSIVQSGAFAYQQLFTPPSRRAIAIEPITAATNAFNRPELGLILLRHGQSCTAGCTISLTRR